MLSNCSETFKLGMCAGIFIVLFVFFVVFFLWEKVEKGIEKLRF